MQMSTAQMTLMQTTIDAEDDTDVDADNHTDVDTDNNAAMQTTTPHKDDRQ
jgi:hypothetical protein